MGEGGKRGSEEELERRKTGVKEEEERPRERGGGGEGYLDVYHESFVNSNYRNR